MFIETSNRTISDLQFEFPDISNWTMHGPTGHYTTNNFSATFVHYFGRILLTDCPFDLILLPLAS
jgi:hypothetical protein